MTDKAGVGGTDFGGVFHTGATFFDYDRDGKLDLYVAAMQTSDPTASATVPSVRGRPSSCRPIGLRRHAGRALSQQRRRNIHQRHKEAKIYQPKGLNLSVAAADYDNDGWPDLFVANDGMEAYLYHNKHNGTFTEIAVTSGMALTVNGAAMAAMCISLGDYDNDGFLDLYISDFQLLLTISGATMARVSSKKSATRSGITVPTQNVLSFGGGFFDYDNDGWLDLFIANGHVYEEVEQVFPDIHYKQINSLFHNDGTGRFTEVTAIAGMVSRPHAGRGAAFADFDNDGNVDIVVANNGDPPLLLHNSGGAGNHFITSSWWGTKSNRDAMGARMQLKSGGISQIREIAGGGSYLSQSDLRAHFGLGRAQG